MTQPRIRRPRADRRPPSPPPDRRGLWRRRSRRFRRTTGCLMWVATLLLVLLVLSLLFGGFQRGAKVGGAPALGPAVTRAAWSATGQAAGPGR
jgi:hypothetical protein